MRQLELTAGMPTLLQKDVSAFHARLTFRGQNAVQKGRWPILAFSSISARTSRQPKTFIGADAAFRYDDAMKHRLQVFDHALATAHDELFPLISFRRTIRRLLPPPFHTGRAHAPPSTSSGTAGRWGAQRISLAAFP